MTPEEAAARCQRLTPRHAEVLALAAKQGLLYVQIANQLGINEHTVRKYACAVRRTLRATTMSQAAFIATKAGLL
jgi:DNA-binding NarL/FixJ family response regulator